MTLFEQYVEKLKNNRLIAVAMIVGVCLSALIAFLDDFYIFFDHLRSDDLSILAVSPHHSFVEITLQNKTSEDLVVHHAELLLESVDMVVYLAATCTGPHLSSTHVYHSVVDLEADQSEVIDISYVVPAKTAEKILITFLLGREDEYLGSAISVAVLPRYKKASDFSIPLDVAHGCKDALDSADLYAASAAVTASVRLHYGNGQTGSTRPFKLVLAGTDGRVGGLKVLSNTPFSQEGMEHLMMSDDPLVVSAVLRQFSAIPNYNFKPMQDFIEKQTDAFYERGIIRRISEDDLIGSYQYSSQLYGAGETMTKDELLESFEADYSVSIKDRLLKEIEAAKTSSKYQIVIDDSGLAKWEPCSYRTSEIRYIDEESGILVLGNAVIKKPEIDLKLIAQVACTHGDRYLGNEQHEEQCQDGCG